MEKYGLLERTTIQMRSVEDAGMLYYILFLLIDVISILMNS
jgi:hypothetical protein